MGKHSDGDDTERLFVSHYVPKHDEGDDSQTVEIPALPEDHPTESKNAFSRVVTGAISLTILVILAVVAVVAVVAGAWMLFFALSLIKELLVVVVLAVLLLLWFTRGT